MMNRKLKIAAIAAGFAMLPMIGTAANSTTALNSCTKAFVADLSARTTTTLKLRDAHYVADSNWATSGTSELALTARDAHTNHALARALCTVNSQGAVIELQTEPLFSVNND